MKVCERCGNKYHFGNISENVGHHLCRTCLEKCSVCGKKIPFINKLGQRCSVSTGLFTPIALIGTAGQQERKEKPWIGSGLCMECYNAKRLKEEEEQELFKQAKLKKAKDILETPSVWECPYCNAVNRGNFCSNCGSPRRRSEYAHNETRI